MLRAGAIFLGGCLGGLLRYAFVFLFPNSEGEFPLTIYLENISGAFLLGFAMTVLIRRAASQSPAWAAFFCTGVLGSFTTFSNFSLDVVRLGLGGETLLATVYLVSSVACGLMAALLGVLLARQCLGAWNR